MEFGYQYNGTVSKCHSGPRLGNVVLLNTLIEFIPGLRSLGIFNCRPKRTSSSLSLHADGRADDIAPDTAALGTMLAFFLVAAAQLLGVQRVIWGFGTGHAAKEWDSREGERYWEDYSGPAHDDHAHCELCLAAANTLTRDMVIEALRRYWGGPLKKPLPGGGLFVTLKPEEEKRILDQSDLTYKALFDERDGKKVNVIDELRKLVAEVLAEVKKP